MDEVIAGYRWLTGKAPILPKWAYGFWQSRQPITPKGNFATQKDLLEVVTEYRKRGLPLDNIVQDWFYWPEDQWGCQCVDTKRYPDAKAMVDQFHANNVHAMISVWAKYYKGIPNYQAMDAIGGIYRRMDTPRPDEPKDPNYIKAMYLDWVGPGYLNAFYDPYNPQGARPVLEPGPQPGEPGLGRVVARFRRARFPFEHLQGRNRLPHGPDRSGPGGAAVQHLPAGPRRRRLPQPGRATSPTSARSSSPARHSAESSATAPRCGRATSLRAGRTCATRFRPGVNFSMSGVPNWSHDIGGFAHEDRYTDPKGKDLDEWRELNTRWFQFGAFSPLFRSHGEYPFREIYALSPEGSPTYRSMEYYDKLRYRLMPYIYTLGADTYFKDGTIMRGLVMDFAADKRSWGIDDEYLFGPALLVAPVTEYKARERKVYLPAGASWYDFYTGRSVAGGQTITAAAPYERMPLFVRAGAIVPTGPAIQFTGNNSRLAADAQRLHRRERKLLGVRGRRSQPPVPTRQVRAHSAQVERAREDAHYRRARGQLSRNGRQARNPHPLDAYRGGASAGARREGGCDGDLHRVRQ